MRMYSIRGKLKIPGDKSITHRALMLAAIFKRDLEICIDNWLPSLDCMATIDALACMGVKYVVQDNKIIIRSVGLYGLHAPDEILYAGNSGTTMRLLAGILVGQKFSSVITGDASLRKRPMARIIEPLASMGARIFATDNNFAPLSIEGNQQLRPITYAMPVASAQVKSAIMLASLYAGGPSQVSSPNICRDHSEIMFNSFDDKIYIPNDFSAAAFFIVAATIVPGSDLLLPSIGINPTRSGLLHILQQMGANITLERQQVLSGELRADLRVRSAKKLIAIDISKEVIPNIIDEIPILCLAAASALGTTVIRGAGELRHKESDRIKLMINGLQTLGVQVVEFVDGLAITGGPIGGGIVASGGDHRIAMTFKIASLVAQQEIIVQDSACIATSFPNFDYTLEEALYEY